MDQEIIDRLDQELAKLSGTCKQSFYEDVHSVLTLSKWSDEEWQRFDRTPNLLREVALAVYDDDVFSTVFELRVKSLALELARK